MLKYNVSGTGILIERVPVIGSQRGISVEPGPNAAKEAETSRDIPAITEEALDAMPELGILVSSDRYQLCGTHVTVKGRIRLQEAHSIRMAMWS